MLQSMLHSPDNLFMEIILLCWEKSINFKEYWEKLKVLFFFFFYK
jgi:hypothetical protein